jgi:tRNA(Ile2) C34 agmatinyltransferase TiaS
MLSKDDFIENVVKLIDRWSFEQCAFCEGGRLISLEGMLDFRCSKCGKSMNPVIYLGEIAKLVFSYREQQETTSNNK